MASRKNSSAQGHEWYPHKLSWWKLYGIPNQIETPSGEFDKESSGMQWHPIGNSMRDWVAWTRPDEGQLLTS